MEIGKRLALARDRAGMSQDALAASTGLSRTTITKMENNVSSPTLATLYAYLTACGLSLAEFFEAKIPKSYSDPVHQELHEKLQVILESGESFFNGIKMNIDGIYALALESKRLEVTAGRTSKINVTPKGRNK